MNEQLSLFSDGLQSITAGLGTERDKFSSVEYAVDELNDEQLATAYRTSWLARKIVDIPALDAFRAWRQWQAEEDQIEAIEEEEKRLGVQIKAKKAAKMARLYGDCYLYFDMGSTPGLSDPRLPLDPTKVKKGGIRFLTMLSHRQLSPGEVEQDPLSPEFGQPKWYDVIGSTQGQVRIHPSRIIVFQGNDRPEEDFYRGGVGGRKGESVLVALLTSVKQFDATAANIASLIFEAKIDVISVKGLMNHIAGNLVEEQKLLSRYSLAARTKGNNGMLIIDGDMEEYQQKSASFSALPDIMDRFGQNASGAADIPTTRLFGQSPGGMNSTGESDLRNYYDRISSGQELEIRPAMRTFDECLIMSALGSRPPEVYYTWKPLWQVSATERAALGKSNAETMKTIKDTGLIPDEVLSQGVVNMMTQDGVIPGFESEYTKFFEEGGTWDLDERAAAEAEAAAALKTPADPDDPTAKKKPDLKVVGDEQPRAPKGSANGGQWVKNGGGGGSGGGSDHAPGSREELGALVKSGADLEEIKSHVALITMVNQMEAREPTTSQPGYDSDLWHEARTYTIDDKTVQGTEAALEKWEKQAEELAWVETKRPPEPIGRDRELTLILGPPAAGKSTIANELAVAKKAMILDSDEIKKSLPEFQKGLGTAAVHEESTALANRLQRLAIAQGSNVVLPKVGDHPESIEKVVSLYKSNGYKVNIVNMAVDPVEAEKRNISRFVATGRLVPPKYVEHVGSKPSSTYRTLKTKGIADGYAEIDNNGAFGTLGAVLDRSGADLLAGTPFGGKG